MYYYSATVGSSLSSPTATKVLSQGDNKTGHIVILLYLSIFGGGSSRWPKHVRIWTITTKTKREHKNSMEKPWNNVLKLEKRNIRPIVFFRQPPFHSMYMSVDSNLDL